MNIIPIRAKGPLIPPDKLKAVLKRAMTDLTAEGVRFMAEYPPAPPNQRYQRTGKLKLSWSPDVTQPGNRTQGVVGSASNIAPYNRKVQGEEQKPFFRGRGWRNVDDLVKKLQAALPGVVQAEIDKVAS